MRQAIFMIQDIINDIEISGMNLDDRDKGKDGDLILENIRIKSRFLDYDYLKISQFVNNKLTDICKKYSCNVLYCAERSSHVWGSSHCKSDNDVKAVIWYNQRDYYSPIKQISKSFKCIYGPRDNQRQQQKKKKNVEEIKNMEQEPDVELNCIELTKISQMIIKNDPNVFEIFISPLPYFIKDKDVIDRFRKIIFATYNWYKLATHYIAWSNGNYKQLTNTSKKRIAKKPLKMFRKFI